MFHCQIDKTITKNSYTILIPLFHGQIGYDAL